MSYFECFSVTLMLQCNLTKSDESTFFVLNVDCVFVRNSVLPYITENAKTLRCVDPHAIYSLSSAFRCYIWCKLNRLLK